MNCIDHTNESYCTHNCDDSTIQKITSLFVSKDTGYFCIICEHFIYGESEAKGI